MRRWCTTLVQARQQLTWRQRPSWARLRWPRLPAELRQQQDAPGVAYSFKYFQQVEGDIVLPPGVKPVRLIVRLVPASGPPVEQSLTWSEATAPAVAAKPAGS